MSDKENGTPTYIDYPFDRFLKLRIEFLILTQNDLKARIMRIIERCIENERDGYYRAEANKPSNKNKEIVVPDGIFATISHKFFMDELYGTVQSETTVRDALAELAEDDHLIIRRPGKGGPYDAPYYTLNKPFIEHLFKLFPDDLKQINMLSVMKQPRKSKENTEVQFLDPLTQKIRGAIFGPLEVQFLDPYSPIIVPLSRSGGVQLLDPIRYTDTSEDSYKNTNSVSNDNASFSSDIQAAFEQMQKEIASLKAQNAELSTKVQQPSTRNTQASTVPVGGNAESKQPVSHSQPTTNTPPASDGKSNNKRTKKDASQDLTLQGSHIIELYEAFKKRKITRNPANVKAANGLGDVVANDTDLNEVLTVIANDKYLKEKDVRVDLDFVYRKYDGFFDVVVRLREKAARGQNNSNNNQAPVSLADKQAEFSKHAKDQERLQQEMERRRAAIAERERKQAEKAAALALAGAR